MVKLNIYFIQGTTMLLNSDAKQLEWVGATYLSQDKVALKEIWNGEDQHNDNQKRFGLPSRLIAKTFVFRLIYGGQAYSYAHDINFDGIGNEDFWQNVIDEFYAKYPDLKLWHDSLLETAKRTGKIIMPTGREYNFAPVVKFDRAEWPRTKILNYPVQGLGADLMTIARVSLFNRLKNRPDIKFITTVHDSILLDFDETKHDPQELVNEVDKCFNNVPINFKKLFGVEFNLPMRVESEIGSDWGNMKTLDKNY